MSRTLITLFTLILLSSSALATSRVAFERGDSIWIAKTDGSGAKRISKGSGPDLSPDGKKVAFTSDDSTKTDLVRLIAVADLGSGKKNVFKDGIPSTNCQRPVWSPDGSQILFEIWSDADWHLALINSDGSNFSYLRKTTPKGNSFWSACWAHDGKSIYAQNLDIISQMDLKGAELKKWSIASVFPNGGLSSGSKLALSRDGRTMAIDLEMQDEEANLPDWDGPPPALWMLELESGKTERLTPKGACAWSPCWNGAKELFFGMQKPNEKSASIYKFGLEEKEPRRVLQNANNPSLANAE